MIEEWDIPDDQYHRAGKENYFKEKHAANEAELKKIIEEKFGVTLEKLTNKYTADFLAFRFGRAVALIEVKERTFEMGRFPTALLALDKVLNGLYISEPMSIPYMYFCKWTDQLAYVELTREYYQTTQIQKKDFRNDKQDIQPSIYIPIANFNLI